MQNKTLCLIVALLLVFTTIFSGCTVKSKSSTAALEKEIIKQKAIGISMAMYTGADNYLKENCIDTVYEDLINPLQNNENLKIKFISTKGYQVEADNTIRLTVQINETEDSSVIFHNMKFEKIKGEWILVEFNIDA